MGRHKESTTKKFMDIFGLFGFPLGSVCGKLHDKVGTTLISIFQFPSIFLILLVCMEIHKFSVSCFPGFDLHVCGDRSKIQ